MLRRELFGVALGAFAVRLLPAGSEEAGLVMSLRLVPEVPDAQGHLEVDLKNTSTEGQDIWVADGEVPKMQFWAVARNGHPYPIVHRGMYRPCAGLCNWPVVQHLDPGRRFTLTIALNYLLYVPEKQPYTTLDVLLQQGCSVRASFEVRREDLAPRERWHLQPSWF